MITKLLSTLTLFVALIATTGCISIPRQEFSKTAAQPIKKIAIVKPHSTEMRVVNIGGAGGAFGLIGAAIEAAEEERKSTEFARQMQVHELSMGAELTRAVEEQLKNDGYEVTVLSDQHPVVVDETESEFDYQGIRTDADAILHLWFAGLGYVSPPDLTNYIPRVGVRARLLAANTKAQLYYQAYLYGWNPVVENIEPVPAAAKYMYGDFDALMTKSQDAAEGLRLGAKGVAARIGRALK